MTDTVAAERMVARLLAVQWDDDAVYRHQRSRGLLIREFVRRTAQWAQALGAKEGWPFGDLARALDPEVSVDPALLAKLEIDAATAGINPIRPEHAAAIVRWAALGDLPRQRFPELDDPYEPLLALFDRGGGYSQANGFIEIGYGAFPKLSVAERAELEPLAIDPATLDALDRKS
ncbi:MULTISPECIES: hypothetical protein [unclassified Kribbella]|uniref:hypothetical protein n=1 Tax=unclassified Kribbella TaxID=2644121 RepID=UPI0033C6E183